MLLQLIVSPALAFALKQVQLVKIARELAPY